MQRVSGYKRNLVVIAIGKWVKMKTRPGSSNEHCDLKIEMLSKYQYIWIFKWKGTHSWKTQITKINTRRKDIEIKSTKYTKMSVTLFMKFLHLNDSYANSHVGQSLNAIS